jgi:hypothetical protein
MDCRLPTGAKRGNACKTTRDLPAVNLFGVGYPNETVRRGLMLDNLEVAVLTKLNDLADRYGLKPYDFVATFKHGAKSWILEFECPASGNDLREERYDKMLTAIGITSGDRAALKGDAAKIIDALDNALDFAPRSRHRF